MMYLAAFAMTVAVAFQGAGNLESKEIKVGKGRSAQAKDLVTVEYTGTLTNGKPFDSSKGKPPFIFTLGAGQVIKGWDQGVAGMKEGGRRRLTIPPSLAYGDKDNDGIPKNSTLVFDVELLHIDRPGDKQTLDMKTTAPGTGEPAKDGEVVDVHYNGTFLNGTKFDSSYDRKEPLHITMGKTRLIQGFTQGLKNIKVGEKRHLVIPYTLAYGDKQRGGIPPFSTLVFDIEAVKPATKAELAKKAEEERKLISIEEIAPGAGAEAKDGDMVEIHYVGTFPDGKKFDSSRDRGQTFSFKLGAGQVIKGFDMGVLGMKVGGKRKVTIPPELGYGARGAGSAVPPNSTLVFEIELISVK